MSEGVSRTFIGSVVCVDLVGYSTRSVAQQIAIKDVFNRLLGQALERIPEEDRIILDTGDGAAVSFLGDPEQGLAVGLAVRDAMHANASALGAAAGAGDAVRMGINLGPVKLAVDLNGYPKIIGDGLNVAERIMGFALPGQIAVSRSFVDMVSRLSDENARLFRLEGMRTDKNGREHQVFVVDPGAGAPKSRAASAASASGDGGALVAFLEDKLKVGAAAAVLLAMILGEGALLARKARTAPAPTMAEATKPTEPAPLPKPAEARSVALAPAKSPERKAEPKAEPKIEMSAPPKTEPKVEASAPPKVEPVKPAARKEEPAAKTAAPEFSPVAPKLQMVAPLNFPAEATARGFTAGSVRARLTIDASGNVTRVVVLSATPARGFFDEEAMRSLRDWKFDRGPANRQYVADIEFKK